MKLIDRQYLATPFYGARKVTACLKSRGQRVNRKRIRRLMRVMGLKAIYRRPMTSKPAPDHKIYPYLLGGLRVTRPNQVWAATVIMQPSTREGFGLVITEALWKGKPVIAANVGSIPLQIREGDTGYFYETPVKTSRRMLGLLKNPRAVEAIGNRGKQYVGEHFLLPDRVADYIMAMEMAVDRGRAKKMPPDSITSFHPWFKLSKRRG